VIRRFAVPLVVAILLVGLGATALPAGAGETPSTESAPTTLPSGNGVGHIVLRPDYGHEPTGPNDRGGWQQLLLFGLLCGGVLALGGFAWRDSRRKRRRAEQAAAGEPAVARPTSGPG
jgi:hypothetical protein